MSNDNDEKSPFGEWLQHTRRADKHAKLEREQQEAKDADKQAKIILIIFLLAMLTITLAIMLQNGM